MSYLSMERTRRHPSIASVYRLIGGPSPDRYLSCNLLSDLPLENPVKVHTAYCAFLVLEGRGVYLDQDGTSYPLLPGTWAQHIPGRSHTVRRDGNACWVELSLSLSLPLYRAFGDIGIRFPACPVTALPSWRRHQAQLMDFYRRCGAAVAGDYPALAAEAMRILDEVHRDHERETFASAAKRALSADPAGRAPLESVAAGFGMGYHAFRRRFKNETGDSPGAYRIAARIEQARALLRNPEHTIAETAEILGYPDPFVFSKQFHAIVGISPLRYRESLAGEARSAEYRNDV